MAGAEERMWLPGFRGRIFGFIVMTSCSLGLLGRVLPLEFCEDHFGTNRSGACPGDGLFEIHFLMAYMESPFIDGSPCICVSGTNEGKEGFVDVDVFF